VLFDGNDEHWIYYNDKPTFWAYEMDWFASDHTWEIYWSLDTDILFHVDEDHFAEWLDAMRAMGYDVLINTLESWEAIA
jgi:hypothetical protein